MLQPACRPCRAFTLIELLIVVAIIAILAAIAVPNYLQAQTRSKVSRVQSDMRTLATAIEAYRVDQTRYPWVTQTFSALGPRIGALTTPVAYLSSSPADPFVRRAGTLFGKGSAEDPDGDTYVYNSGNILSGLGNSDPSHPGRQSWSISSAGPDQDLQLPYWPFSPSLLSTPSWIQGVYDPTNGSVSRGDIFRRGGRIDTPNTVLDSVE